MHWLDLIVDVVSFPDGRTIVLDEDEVPANIPELDKKLIEGTKFHLLANLKQITQEIESSTNKLLLK